MKEDLLNCLTNKNIIFDEDTLEFCFENDRSICLNGKSVCTGFVGFVSDLIIETSLDSTVYENITISDYQNIVERDTAPWKIAVYGVLCGTVITVLCCSCCYYKRNYITDKTKALPGIIKGTTTESAASRFMIRVETNLYNLKCKMFGKNFTNKSTAPEENFTDETINAMEKEIMTMQKILNEMRLENLKKTKFTSVDPSEPGPQSQQSSSKKEERVEPEKKKSHTTKTTKADVHRGHKTLIDKLRMPAPPPPPQPKKEKLPEDEIQRAEDLGSEQGDEY